MPPRSLGLPQEPFLFWSLTRKSTPLRTAASTAADPGGGTGLGRGAVSAGDGPRAFGGGSPLVPPGFGPPAGEARVNQAGPPTSSSTAIKRRAFIGAPLPFRRSPA